MITPGDCFRNFIRQVRENEGELLIRNTLITPGDWFRSFIRHVRENEGELLIWNIVITPGDCLLTFIRHVREIGFVVSYLAWQSHTFRQALILQWDTCYKLCP